MTAEEKRSSIIEAVSNLPYEEQNFIVKHLYDSLQKKRRERISDLRVEIRDLESAQKDLEEKFDFCLAAPACHAEAMH